MEQSQAETRSVVSGIDLQLFIRRTNLLFAGKKYTKEKQGSSWPFKNDSILPVSPALQIPWAARYRPLLKKSESFNVRSS